MLVSCLAYCGYLPSHLVANTPPSRIQASGGFESVVFAPVYILF